MKRWSVRGYDKLTGAKRVIVVNASTTKHAITVAYGKLTYPKVIGRA